MLDVAFNHRQRGDIQTLKRIVDAGRLGRLYYAKAWWLRRTGIPTLGSWFTSAEQAGGGPLLDIGVHVLDYSLFLLGQPRITTVSASTYDLLGTRRLRLRARRSGKTGATGAQTFDVEDLATVVHAPARTAGRCWSRRAGPRTARPATSSASRSTAPRAARS